MYDYSRTLTPYTLPKRPRRPFLALAITTDGYGGPFVSARYVTEDQPDSIQTVPSVAAWCDALLSSRGSRYLWYAHNGGEYDYKYLLDELSTRLDRMPDSRIDVIAQGRDRVIGFVIHHGHRRWELRDSYALVPVPLAQLVADMAPQHQTEDSVVGLLHSVSTVDTLITQTFQARMSWTVGATALKAWRATIPEHQYYLRTRPAVEAFCREGYYGGLTFLRSTARHRDCVTLDVNSMYPSVMRACGVPGGVAAYTSTERPGPAFYRVVADIPRTCPRPPLPVRDETGVVWPTGHIETVCTSEEVTFARRIGCAVRVVEGYVFQQLVYPFKQFIDRCEAIRQEWAGTARGMLAKLLQNNLYGKFGSRPWVERYALLNPAPTDYSVWRPVINEVTGEILPHLYYTLDEMQQPYLKVEWAAWITAQARLKLLRAIYAIGARDVLYGDTDSLTATRPAIEAAWARGAVEIGPRYGQFKIEREYTWFHAGAGKNYQGLLADGRMLDRAAGIQTAAVTSSDHARALAGESVTVETQATRATMQLLRGGKGVRYPVQRTYPRVAQAGEVLPPHHEGVI